MKIFQLIRKYFAVLGIEPHQPFEKNHSNSMLLRNLSVFFLLILFVTSSIAFFLFEAKTFKQYSESFYLTVTILFDIALFVITFRKMDKLFKLFDDVESLIRQRSENPESIKAYQKLHENIEKWTGVFHFVMVQVSVPGVMMPKFIMSFYLYFATDLGSDAFSLPFPVWAPFNWQTPLGYLLVFIIQCVMIYYMAHLANSCICTLVVSSYILIALCNEIKSEIHALNETSKTKDDSVNLMMEKVKSFVELHNAVKQLAFDLDNIFALIIIATFIWSLLTISNSLLVIHLAIAQNVQLAEIIEPSVLAFWSFAFLFLFCQFGQALTDHFDQLNDTIYVCEWTSFPKEIQKILPIIIQNTQLPVVLRTFEEASCNRESYKKVVNVGFSYFMVLRNF